MVVLFQAHIIQMNGYLMKVKELKINVGGVHHTHDNVEPLYSYDIAKMIRELI